MIAKTPFSLTAYVLQHLQNLSEWVVTYRLEEYSGNRGKTIVDKKIVFMVDIYVQATVKCFGVTRVEK